MENVKILDANLVEVNEEAFAKKLKTKSDDFKNLSSTPHDVVQEEIIETAPIEDYYEEEVKTDEFKVPVEEIKEYEEIPAYEEAKEEVVEEPTYEQPKYEDSYKPVSAWKEAGAARVYTTPVISNPAPVVTPIVDNAEHYKKLLNSGKLSPTAAKVLTKRLEEIDSIDSDISVLEDEKVKAKSLIEQLENQKALRVSGKKQLENFVETTQRIDLDEIKKALEKADASEAKDDVEVLGEVISRISEKTKKADEAIEKIEAAKNKEKNILSKIEEETENRIESKKGICASLTTDITRAEEADKLEIEKKRTIEAKDKEIEMLNKKKQELLATLPLFEEEEPKKVASINSENNIFDKFKEEDTESYAKVA